MARNPEGNFQDGLKKKLENMFPDSYVAKIDTGIQGFPDLGVFLSSGKWITLECKKDRKAAHQPNQDYYVDDLDSKGYSAFIYPENEKEILDDIQRTFGDKARKRPRVSRSKSA